MATFVLVHGAYHGGWCWRKVVPYLRRNSHDVHTPTLTGLGERSHLYSPEIGIEIHVQDVVNVILYEDLSEVILVGHSLAGIMITGVAQAIPETLSKLVYLDAFTPEDGQCYLDLVGQRERDRIEEMQRSGAENRVTDFSEPFGVSDPSDIAWLEAKLTPHPIKGVRDPVRFSKKEALALPKAYINCTRGSGGFSDISSDSEGWDYYEMDAVHDVMVTQPEELAELLHSIAT